MLKRIWKFFHKKSIEEIDIDWEDDIYWNAFRPTLWEIILHKLSIILLIFYIFFVIILFIFIKSFF